MTVLSPSPTNDIELEILGEVAVLKLSNGRDAYGAILKARILTLQGELQLDVERGIPYDETVWASVRNIERWKLLVRAAVEEYDFVDSITSLEVSVSGRKLEYTMNVLTKEGEVEVIGEA